MAGAISQSFTYPLDFMRTRIGVDSHSDINKRLFKGYPDMIRKIYSVEGIKGFYKGYLFTLCFYFFYRASYFGPFEILKQKKDVFRNNLAVKWSITQLYMMSFQLLFYPIDTVRRRIMMQSGRGKSQQDYTGVFNCVQKIYQKEGISGFFKGVWVNQI